MKIAVLSLTRDRLDYTRTCFQSLRDNAGCAYDWFVLDNGSEDGTPEWLEQQDDITSVCLPTNIGIGQGLNYLLDEFCETGFYDAIAHFDNDCHVTAPNTLRDLCDLVTRTDCVLSPRILGLQNPPRPTREILFEGETLLDVPQIGGIFLTAPGWWYDFYRYPANLPLWGMDDAHLCQSFREQGGMCGYVDRLEAWHYEGTDGQRERWPDYFARKDAEYMAVAR